MPTEMFMLGNSEMANATGKEPIPLPAETFIPANREMAKKTYKRIRSSKVDEHEE